MTDEDRLFDAATDPLERALLEEARSFGASERARTRTLAALGLSTKATAGGGGGSSLGVKIGAGVASIGIAVAIAYGVSAHRAEPSSSSSTPPVVAAAPASAHEATPKVATSAVEPAVVVAAPPSASVSSSAASKLAVASVRPAPKPAENDGLSEEVRLIDAARQALYDHDKEATLRALAEYDRRFPKGRMAPEAERLRQRARDLR